MNVSKKFYWVQKGLVLWKFGLILCKFCALFSESTWIIFLKFFKMIEPFCSNLAPINLNTNNLTLTQCFKKTFFLPQWVIFTPIWAKWLLCLVLRMCFKDSSETLHDNGVSKVNKNKNNECFGITHIRPKKGSFYPNLDQNLHMHCFQNLFLGFFWHFTGRWIIISKKTLPQFQKLKFFVLEFFFKNLPYIMFVWISALENWFSKFLAKQLIKNAAYLTSNV